MKEKGLFKVVAFVLLFAIQWAILPLSQVFHKHHASVGIEKQGHVVLKKYEKPCCHAFEVTLLAEVPTFFKFSFELPAFAWYSGYSSPAFSNQFVSFSNKAPPVKIV